MQNNDSRASPQPPLAGSATAAQDQAARRPSDTITTVEPQSQAAPFMDAPAQATASGFTAVNNREPLPSAPANNGGMNNENNRRMSEDKPEQRQRITPPGQEKLTITTSNTQRNAWAETVNGDRNGSTQGGQYGDIENPHKRKRSGSFGGEREASQGAQSGSFHKHSLPSLKSAQQKGSPETPYPNSAASKRDAESATRDAYATPQTPYTHYSDGRENSAASWYSQSASAVSQHHMTPEEQLRDALQRDNNNNSDGQDHYSEASPGNEDNRGASYQGQYGSVQADHKKRKRNFSNRTKTGCMTCRKRKKKCDEARPECQNCIRGGFLCNGYPSRGQWPKTEQKQGPVPLQSKDGYDAAHASPSQTQQPQYQSPAYQQAPPPPQQQQQQQQQHQPHPSAPQTQTKREPLPSYRGQQLRVDPLQPPARPLGDDDRASASTLNTSIGSPDKRGLHSAVTPYTPANPFPTPISAVSSHTGYPTMESYPRLPQLIEPGRNEHHEASTPQSAHSTVPQISILNPSHSNSPHPHPHPHTPQSTAAQDAARLALSLPASNRMRTQKEEMLAGRAFHQFDPELTAERERCNTAVWRFNNSMNPANGMGKDERQRLFKSIIQPTEPTTFSGNQPPTQGYLPETGVEVKAPFTCTYGYNIHIGKDVLIEDSCRIMDCAKVTIGDRCVIGPNVSLLTQTLPLDPKKRNGSKGPSYGKGITIEDDCWIGANVTILAGLKVGRGSTIGASSVVTANVPQFTVVTGVPARVQRGIFSEER